MIILFKFSTVTLLVRAELERLHDAQYNDVLVQLFGK